MINFFDACEEYHNLRFTTIPLNVLLTNLNEFRPMMAEDKEFWNPQPADVNVPAALT